MDFGVDSVLKDVEHQGAEIENECHQGEVGAEHAGGGAYPEAAEHLCEYGYSADKRQQPQPEAACVGQMDARVAEDSGIWQAQHDAACCGDDIFPSPRLPEYLQNNVGQEKTAESRLKPLHACISLQTHALKGIHAHYGDENSGTGQHKCMAYAGGYAGGAPPGCGSVFWHDVADVTKM